MAHETRRHLASAEQDRSRHRRPGALALTGCAQEGHQTTGAVGGSKAGLCATPGGNGPKIGLAYDVGGRGDKSFNDLACGRHQEGRQGPRRHLQRVRGGADEPDSAKRGAAAHPRRRGLRPDHRGRLRLHPDGRPRSPRSTPKLKFAVVDGCGPDRRQRTSPTWRFAAEQGSFLVGVAAGLKTKTNKVGFVGGVKRPDQDPFEAGYQAGVKAVNPKAKVDDEVAHPTRPTTKAFAEPARWQDRRDGALRQRRRHRLPRRRPSGNGVFEAAAAGEGKWAIGVDSDQYLTAPDGAEAAHPDLGAQARRRRGRTTSSRPSTTATTKPGFDVYDLKSDGVGYATTGGQHRRHQGQDRRLQGSKIKTGEIKVPNEP